jgi:hypothetical protein
VRWTVAGFLLAGTVTIRPLTGVAMTASLLLWQIARAPQHWRTFARTTPAFVLGAALPIAALLYFNNVTNGSPFVFGYDVAHGGRHALGFGQRGFLTPNETGQWVEEVAHFGPRRAAVNAARVAADLGAILGLVIAFAAPLMALAWRSRYRIRWLTVAAFVPLPVAYFFYFYPHSRFYLELFPFFFVGVAGIHVHVRQHNPASARAIAVALIAGQLVLTALDLRARVDERRQSRRYAALAAVERAMPGPDGLLVFVDGEDLLNWLAWCNIGEFPGRVIVARDLGDENRRLMRRFPGHRPVRLQQEAPIVRLDPVQP